MTGPSAEDEVVLICDERVTSIPSLRADDALVDAGEHLPVDTRKADGTGSWRQLRKPVLDRLLDATAALPGDLRLTLVEGYRPPSLQAA